MQINKLFFLTSWSIFLLISCHDTPYMQGKRLYEAKCANCHMSDGSGLQKMIPSLAESEIIGDTNLACTIISGKNDTVYEGTSYWVKYMPSFTKLSTTEVANIVNYINHRWDSEFKESTIIDIENVLANCKPN